MRKYVPIYLFISLFLNSMDAPNPLNMNHWEFFSETNDLDRIGPAIPFWQSAENYSIETITHLYLLDNSNLCLNNRSILDIECKTGEVAYFLAQKGTAKVIGYSAEEKNIAIAKKKFKHQNLIRLSNEASEKDRFDLIVSCYPLKTKLFLTEIKVYLNPQGEIFCLLKTESNERTIEEKALNAMSIPFASKENISDELIKNIIAQEGFEIITYEQKKGMILICPHERQKVIAGCTSFFKSLPVASFSDTDPTKTKKWDKRAHIFAKKFVQLLKKDAEGNWFYPYDYTVIHIKKLND